MLDSGCQQITMSPGSRYAQLSSPKRIIAGPQISPAMTHYKFNTTSYKVTRLGMCLAPSVMPICSKKDIIPWIFLEFMEVEDSRQRTYLRWNFPKKIFPHFQLYWRHWYRSISQELNLGLCCLKFSKICWKNKKSFWLSALSSNIRGWKNKSAVHMSRN